MNSPHYHSPLFRDFRSIEQDDHLRVIRFFEEREAEIGQLVFEEYYDLLLAYVEALYALSEFRKHLLVVDYAIEATINHDAPTTAATDIFQQLLYQKAMSYFRNLEPQRAEHILRELLRINPAHTEAAILLHRSLYRQQVRIQQLSRAGAIICFGLSAVVILLEALLLRPFYDIYTHPVEWLRNGIFILGIISLVSGTVYTWLRAQRMTHAFLRSLPQRSG